MRRDKRGALGGKRLRFNEMSGNVELGDRPIEDHMISRIASDIELLYPGGVDKNNNELGLRLSPKSVSEAIELVARENAYHPVREYLGGLEWDGVARLDAVCEDILGAERTWLNQLLIRKWFVSAVARAMRPGCKVDTALVLVGKQGAGKSTFFSQVAAPWFLESSIDIQTKDSLQLLRRGWVIEWAELETMRKAKDVSAVKAFLTVRVDTYRPPYGRYPIDVPRTCVIVGTTNNQEFLTDDTGNRRFWPITVGQTDTEALADQREQLWAEAVELFQRGENWWLTEAESAPLAGVHREHETSDPWQADVLSWADNHVSKFGTADVLQHALKIEIGRWCRADEMRVASILRRAGWRQGQKVKHSTRHWIAPAEQLDLPPPPPAEPPEPFDPRDQ